MAAVANYHNASALAPVYAQLWRAWSEMKVWARLCPSDSFRGEPVFFLGQPPEATAFLVSQPRPCVSNPVLLLLRLLRL